MRKTIHFDSAAPDAVERAATQAQRIVARFGGAWKLSRQLIRIGEPVAVQTIYRWLYPDHCGLIPTAFVPRILMAARVAGVTLTDSDWSPVPKGNKS